MNRSRLTPPKTFDVGFWCYDTTQTDTTRTRHNLDRHNPDRHNPDRDVTWTGHNPDRT